MSIVGTTGPVADGATSAPPATYAGGGASHGDARQIVQPGTPPKDGDAAVLRLYLSSSSTTSIPTDTASPSQPDSDPGVSSSEESLGGTVASTPSIVSMRANRLDVFYRRLDGTLGHQWWQPAEGWSGEASLGGRLAGNPSAVSMRDNRLDVFYRRFDGRLGHQWWQLDVNQGRWSGEESLGGAVTADVSAVSMRANRLDVFYRGSGSQLAHQWWQSNVNQGRWSGEEDHGGCVVGRPDAVSMRDNRLDIFYRGCSSQLAHQWWQPQPGWSAEENHGGVVTSGVSAVSMRNNRLDIFYRDNSGQLAHQWWQPAEGWSREESHGGYVVGSPDAVSMRDNRLDIFYRGATNQLAHQSWQPQPGWSGEGSLGGSLSSDPGVVALNQGRVDAFYRGAADSSLRHNFYTQAPVILPMPTDQHQDDSWSCGPNSIARLLRSYGYNVSYAQVRSFTRYDGNLVSRVGMGTPSSALIDSLRYWKTDARREDESSMGRVEQLLLQGTPLIALVSMGRNSIPLGNVARMHYLVLNGIDIVNRQVYYTNTNGVQGWWSYEDFQYRWNWHNDFTGVGGESAQAFVGSLGMRERTIFF